mmetsp:Transcript_8047/g.22363  ORF Transcript_8047/g.22363 Transcript_8047/m.22363 type:complete len:410 (+) Transcript_8047:904-2133(+)
MRLGQKLQGPRLACLVAELAVCRHCLLGRAERQPWLALHEAQLSDLGPRNGLPTLIIHREERGGRLIQGAQCPIHITPAPLQVTDDHQDVGLALLLTPAVEALQRLYCTAESLLDVAHPSICVDHRPKRTHIPINPLLPELPEEHACIFCHPERIRQLPLFQQDLGMCRHRLGLALLVTDGPEDRHCIADVIEALIRLLVAKVHFGQLAQHQCLLLLVIRPAEALQCQLHSVYCLLRLALLDARDDHGIQSADLQCLVARPLGLGQGVLCSLHRLLGLVQSNLSLGGQAHCGDLLRTVFELRPERHRVLRRLQGFLEVLLHTIALRCRLQGKPLAHLVAKLPETLQGLCRLPDRVFRALLRQVRLGDGAQRRGLALLFPKVLEHLQGLVRRLKRLQVGGVFDLHLCKCL